MDAAGRLEFRGILDHAMYGLRERQPGIQCLHGQPAPMPANRRRGDARGRGIPARLGNKDPVVAGA